MKKSKVFLALLVLTLVLTACSGSAEKDVEIAEQVIATEKPADTKVPPTPTPEPIPTKEPEPMMLPISMVSAPIGDDGFQYKMSLPNFGSMSFDVGELPAPPDTVTANWFTSGGFYVIGYYGLDLGESGPLCPGNSIFIGSSGWIHISNAPTEEGACEGLDTVTDDPDVGPVDCGGTLFYRTAIPSDLQGTLYGTIEKIDEDGNLVGITSQTESTPDMLEIDLAAMCQ